MRVFIVVFILALQMACRADAQPIVPQPGALVEEGDLHWNRRADGARGSHADPDEIDRAIESYQEALSADPESLSIRWRLMRALFFKGEYATDDIKLKKRIFDEGRTLGEEALRQVRRKASEQTGRSMERASAVDLAPFFKNSPDVVGCFFWSSASWGKWALAYGKFQAVRKGAAGRIRDLATAVALMDPEYAEGGGYRVLGRLHDQTPHVPFLTGWASTREAVRFLRRANQIGPLNSINRLYLAEALWDENRDTRDEALGLVGELIHDKPRPDFLVEDRAAQEIAQEEQTEWEKKNQ
jgi:tetratricopeptide (TPR) repeat protein